MVSLNSDHDINPDKIIRSFQYDHPVFQPTLFSSRDWITEHAFEDKLGYGGAWMGNGFHEDGVKSALHLCDTLLKKLMHSCLYRGEVTHQRLLPKAYGFSHKLYMTFLDLDEIEEVCKKSPFWSFEKWNLASFNFKDYFTRDGKGLKESLKSFIEEKTGMFLGRQS